MDKLITVLTPTYNRGGHLNKLYQSLINQTETSFIWMIVDDGSTDDTKQVVNNLIQENKIEIDYYYKNNGGKHTALNEGIAKIATVLTFIVDSDDYLLKDAIESIKLEWLKIKNLGLCGIGFLKGYSLDVPIMDKYPIDHQISDYNTITKNRNTLGDKAEVWVTAILKKTPFPVFENEKFLAEGFVWSSIAQTYNMYFVNKIIYIAEYLDGGLTKAGRKLRIKCPLGGMKNASILMGNEYIWKIRIKNAILFDCYGFFAGYTYKNIISIGNDNLLIKLLMPVGYFFYIYWKIKYLADWKHLRGK